MLIEPSDFKDQKAKIYIVGVGGAGGNAINRMIDDGMANVEFIAINTDAQDLEHNNSQVKLQIGKELTKVLELVQILQLENKQLRKTKMLFRNH